MTKEEPASALDLSECVKVAKLPSGEMDVWRDASGGCGDCGVRLRRFVANPEPVGIALRGAFLGSRRAIPGIWFGRLGLRRPGLSVR